MQKDHHRAQHDFPTYQTVKLAPVMDSNGKVIQTLAQRKDSTSYFASKTGVTLKCFPNGRTQHQSSEDYETYSRLNRVVKVDDGQKIPKREKHLDRKQVLIPTGKIYIPHPIQSHTEEPERCPGQKLVRVGGRLMIVVDKQDFEDIAASKWIDTKDSLVPSTYTKSWSKAGKRFKPSQMNHSPPSTLTRLLFRRKAGTANASFVAPTTSCYREETILVHLQSPNEQYYTKARDELRQTCTGIHVLKSNDADKTRTRRVGVCPATDTTKKERQFARVMLKRF